MWTLWRTANRTSPPRPPSPPSGPPRGTYFSRRKDTAPFPPLPELTVIVVRSTNRETAPVPNRAPTHRPDQANGSMATSLRPSRFLYTTVPATRAYKV